MKIHADLIAALFALLLGGMLLKTYIERENDHEKRNGIRCFSRLHDEQYPGRL